MQDFCIDSKHIAEYSCNEGGSFNYRVYECFIDCLDGACGFNRQTSFVRAEIEIVNNEELINLEEYKMESGAKLVLI